MDSVTQNTAVISWTYISDASFYEISYTGPNGEGRKFTSKNPATTLTGLTPASQYVIRVYAISGGPALDIGTTTATTAKAGICMD